MASLDLKTVVLIFTVFCIRWNSSYAAAESQLCFPKDFLFGVATASYQIEGAWNVSGKGESIWDHYTHQYPDRVFDHSNGDVATDSYHLFKEDVKLLAELGVKFYRFSISWPRILPSGFSNDVNKDGIRYYNDLIDELHKHGIEPVVTMYHWDLPQYLQDLGGWTNPIMADYFVDYARVLFDNYYVKVLAWITFNEPLSFCHAGYGGDDAPGGRASGIEDYMCGHNMLRAHGRVYRLYKEYKKKFGGSGKIGVTLDMAWMEAASTSEDDQTAAETARQFEFGWFANPIFSKQGDYPPIMRKRIDENSKRQNYSRSRLPTFTKEELNTIRGSADFLGLNHYTTRMVTKDTGKISVQASYDSDVGVKVFYKDEWPKTRSDWLRVVPWGFRKTLNWIKNTYNNPYVVVTENGMSTDRGLQDLKRISYIDGYLRSLHAAITSDGCNVLAYTHWSLIDNFEWLRGYSERFGLYEVDYDSANRTRTPRLSARYYANIAKTGCIPAQEYYRLWTFIEY